MNYKNINKNKHLIKIKYCYKQNLLWARLGGNLEAVGSAQTKLFYLCGHCNYTVHDNLHSHESNNYLISFVFLILFTYGCQ